MTQQDKDPAIVGMTYEEQKQVKGGEVARSRDHADGDGFMSLSDDHPFMTVADEQPYMSMNDDHI